MNARTLLALIENATALSNSEVIIPRDLPKETQTSFNKFQFKGSKGLSKVHLYVGPHVIGLSYRHNGDISIFRTKLDRVGVEPEVALNVCLAAHDFLVENGHLHVSFLRDLLRALPKATEHYVARRQKVEALLSVEKAKKPVIATRKSVGVLLGAGCQSCYSFPRWKLLRFKLAD